LYSKNRAFSSVHPIHKLYLPRFSEALSSLIQANSITAANDICRASGYFTVKLTISPTALPGTLQLLEQEAAAEATATEAAWKHAWETLRPKILDLLHKPRVHVVGNQKGDGRWSTIDGGRRLRGASDCFCLGGYANGYKLNLLKDGELSPPFAMAVEKLLQLCTEMGWLKEFGGDEYTAAKGPPLFWRVLLELTRSGEVVPLDAESLEPLGTHEDVLAAMEPYVQQEQAAGVEIGGYELDRRPGQNQSQNCWTEDANSTKGRNKTSSRFGVGFDARRPGQNQRQNGWKSILRVVSVAVSRGKRQEHTQKMQAAVTALRGLMRRQVESLVADAEAGAEKMAQQEAQLRLQVEQQAQLAVREGRGLGTAQLRQQVHELMVDGMPQKDIAAAVGYDHSSWEFGQWLNNNSYHRINGSKCTQIEEAVRAWVISCPRMRDGQGKPQGELEGRVEKVALTFTLSKNGPLGISVSAYGVQGVTGQAERLGIQVGDRLSKVNGVDVEGSSVEALVEQLKAMSRPTDVVMKRVVVRSAVQPGTRFMNAGQEWVVAESPREHEQSGTICVRYHLAGMPPPPSAQWHNSTLKEVELWASRPVAQQRVSCANCGQLDFVQPMLRHLHSKQCIAFTCTQVLAQFELEVSNGQCADELQLALPHPPTVAGNDLLAAVCYRAYGTGGRIKFAEAVLSDLEANKKRKQPLAKSPAPLTKKAKTKAKSAKAVESKGTFEGADLLGREVLKKFRGYGNFQGQVSRWCSEEEKFEVAWSDESTTLETEKTVRRCVVQRTFAELWPHLLSQGWLVQEGRGLDNWYYLPPSAQQMRPRDRKRGIDYFVSEEDVLSHASQKNKQTSKRR
jgi:hypothetical protein